MAATATADPINQVFRALADPTRSRIVERLSRGAASEGELARLFDMALPSFVQHLRVLKECGLMRSKMMGRVRVVHVVPRHISVAPT